MPQSLFPIRFFSFSCSSSLESVVVRLYLQPSSGELGALQFPAQLLGLFTSDQAVIRAAIPYLRITSVSYLFTAGTFIFQGVMRSIGIVRLPLYLSVFALSLNALFNYALIFGKFGLPELGINGAALATTGARIVEMLLLIAITYIRKYPMAANFRQLTNQNFSFLKQYTWRVSPVILHEIGWSMGITMFTLIYARMGTSILAAFNITDTFSRLLFFMFIGSANATAIILGNMIGEGKQREAERCANTILLAVPVLSIILSIPVFLAAPLIPSLFNVSQEVSHLITQFMRILAVVLFLKSTNMHLIVGLLRSGGDTHYSMTIELIPLWLLAIPLVAVCGLVLQWSPVIVFAVSMTEELIKCILGVKRILSKKWIHNLT
ncbi:MAG: hypothetical protein B6241_12955 [Spirochaetaceae bacterium 4572_59]|nr:MAG: hypothetical protein B6241_12955 [Spirochaetaceae bacterium 4572_59]